jgi:hypothetical protein
MPPIAVPATSLRSIRDGVKFDHALEAASAPVPTTVSGQASIASSTHPNTLLGLIVD